MDWRDRWKVFVYRRVMAKVAKRPSPNSIPTSAPESYKNKYFSMGLVDPNKPERWAFLFRELLPDGVAGLSFHEVGPGGQGVEHTLKNEELPKYDFEVKYYYKGFKPTYRSAFRFFFDTTLHIPALYRAWYWTVQFIYNRRRLARRDRIRVLRIFLENSVLRDSYIIGPSGLMAALYGKRSFYHPDLDASINYYRLVLDSLAATGDLQSTQNGFKLTGRGLTTLDQYEHEERRHDDNVRIQWILAGLTAVVAIIALAQVYVSVWEETNPDPSPAPYREPGVPISPPQIQF